MLDVDGRLAGLISLARLSDVPANKRVSLRLRDVQTPMARVLVLDSAAPLTETAPAILAGGHRLAPVVVDCQLVGVLTATDISRALELASLGARPDRAVVPDESTYGSREGPQP